jgi:hypothetical protein
VYDGEGTHIGYAPSYAALRHRFGNPCCPSFSPSHPYESSDSLTSPYTEVNVDIDTSMGTRCSKIGSGKTARAYVRIRRRSMLIESNTPSHEHRDRESTRFERNGWSRAYQTVCTPGRKFPIAGNYKFNGRDVTRC